MWFLVDVDEQKVNWENSVMICRRVQLHILIILFARNRSESLIVVLKLTFGTRVFQRQQSRCKIISIILMKYFFVLAFPADEYDAPSQSRSEIQSGDYIPLHRR